MLLLDPVSNPGWLYYVHLDPWGAFLCFCSQRDTIGTLGKVSVYHDKAEGRTVVTAATGWVALQPPSTPVYIVRHIQGHAYAVTQTQTQRKHRNTHPIPQHTTHDRPQICSTQDERLEAFGEFQTLFLLFFSAVLHIFSNFSCKQCKTEVIQVCTGLLLLETFFSAQQRLLWVISDVNYGTLICTFLFRLMSLLLLAVFFFLFVFKAVFCLILGIWDCCHVVSRNTKAQQNHSPISPNSLRQWRQSFVGFSIAEHSK